MHKFPFAHRIKKPFIYVNSVDTDVAKTIQRARDAMKPKAKPANVSTLRKKVAA